MLKKYLSFIILFIFLIPCTLIFTACSCGGSGNSGSGDDAGDEGGTISGISVEVTNQSLAFNEDASAMSVPYDIAGEISWQHDLKVYQIFEDDSISRKEIPFKANDATDGWTITSNLPESLESIAISEYSLIVSYENFEKDITLNVVKKKIQVPTMEQTEFEYTGALITPQINNLDFVHIYDGVGESIQSSVLVGEYSIHYDLVDSANCEWDIEGENKTATQTLNWRITPKVVSIPNVDLTNANVVKNGNVFEFEYMAIIEGNIVTPIAQGFKLSEAQKELYILENATKTDATIGTAIAKLKLKDNTNCIFEGNKTEVSFEYCIKPKAVQRPQRVNNAPLIYSNGATLVPMLNEAYIPAIMQGLVGAVSPVFDVVQGIVQYRDITNTITFKPQYANNYVWAGENQRGVEINFQIHRADFNLPENAKDNLSVEKDYSFGLKLQDIEIYDFATSTSDLSAESLEYLINQNLIPNGAEEWVNLSSFAWSEPQTGLNVGENQEFEFKYSFDSRYFNEATSKIKITINKIQANCAGVEWVGPQAEELVYSATLNPVFTLSGLPNGVVVENEDYHYYYSATESGDYLPAVSKNVVGYYKVTAELTFNENNVEIINLLEEDLTKFYSVKKAEISLANVSVAETTFEYDTLAKSITLNSLPLGVQIGEVTHTYSSEENGEYLPVQSAIEVGYYRSTIELVFDDANCEFSDLPAFIEGNEVCVSFEIVRGRININGLEWSNTAFIHNGSVHNVSIVETSLPTGVAFQEAQTLFYGEYGWEISIEPIAVGRYKTIVSLAFASDKYYLYDNDEIIPGNQIQYEWRILDSSLITLVSIGNESIDAETLISSKSLNIDTELSINVDSGYVVKLNGEETSNFVFNETNKNQPLIIEIFELDLEEDAKLIYSQTLTCFDVRDVFTTLRLNDNAFAYPNDNSIILGLGDKLEIVVNEQYNSSITENGNPEAEITNGIIEFTLDNYTANYVLEIEINGVLGMQSIQKTISCLIINSVIINSSSYGVNFGSNLHKYELAYLQESIEIQLNEQEYLSNVNNLSYVLSGTETASGTFTSNVLNVDVTKYSRLEIKFRLSEGNISTICVIEFLPFSPISVVEVEYFSPIGDNYASEPSTTELSRSEGEFDYHFGANFSEAISIVSAVNVTLKDDFAEGFSVQLLLEDNEAIDFTKLGTKLIIGKVLNGEKQVIYEFKILLEYNFVLTIKNTPNRVYALNGGNLYAVVNSPEIVFEHNPTYSSPINLGVAITTNNGEEIVLSESGIYSFDFSFVCSLADVEYALNTQIIINNSLPAYNYFTNFELLLGEGLAINYTDNNLERRLTASEIESLDLNSMLNFEVVAGYVVQSSEIVAEEGLNFIKMTIQNPSEELEEIYLLI